MSFSVGILTVSDTSFRDGPSSDRSGPVLRELLESLPSSPYKIVASAIAPDKQVEIRRVVEQWCKEGVDLVLTSGGTGFGARDCTPEAVASLIDKPAPGLVTLMLTHSLAITPLAALSRPVVGVHLREGAEGSGTLIVTLPGSPKGAKENLESLLQLLPHTLDLIGGGSGRAVHKAMGAPDRGTPTPSVAQVAAAPAPSLGGHGGGCGHHHHSHGHAAPRPRTLLSQDPSASIAARQRQSPYPLVPLRNAVSLVFEHTYISPVQTLAVEDTLVGHVLAEDVESAQNIPGRPSTNVDGYAVRSTDAPGIYKVVTEYPTAPLPAGTIYRINTGAPLPPGMDAVIMVEDTEVVAKKGEEEQEIKLLAQVDKGENVRKEGSDVKVGEKVLEKGDVISAVGGELGTLAFIAKRSAKVYRRPTVAVLSTGNELVSIQDTSSPKHSSTSFSSIVDSNRPSLLSILKHLHYDTLDLGIIRDTMAETTAALKKGKEQADIVISTGGTSMGVGDLLKPCIERELNGTVHFGRVATKPGKPTTFATLPAHPMAPDQNPKLVFALPGNPASALCTFFLFVLPALRKMEGRRESEWELPRVPVTLTSNVFLDPRPEYHRVWVRPTSSGLKAFSTGGQRSSRTVSLAGSNGLLELPSSSEGEKEKKNGDIVNCVVIGEIGSLLA